MPKSEKPSSFRGAAFLFANALGLAGLWLAAAAVRDGSGSAEYGPLPKAILSGHARHTSGRPAAATPVPRAFAESDNHLATASPDA